MAIAERVPQIKGLLPALDPRQVDPKIIINGENFLIDLEGPYSAFGSTLISDYRLIDHYGVFTFDLDDQVFICGLNGIYILDKEQNIIKSIYVYETALTTQWPISMAKVGTEFFFCHPNLGVLRYNPNTLVWSKITANVPAGAKSICVNSGRLIVLGDTAYAWSTIDDGGDLATSTSTGAGTQSLSGLLSYKTSFMVEAVFNGFIVFTDAGLVKSTRIETINPFRHDVMVGKKFAPISPFSICSIEGSSIVWLTRNGLYAVEDAAPQEWQPLMGKYFAREYLPSKDLSNYTLVRLSYLAAQELVFIQIGDPGKAYVYESAYVLYLSMNEFGAFNRRHTCVGVFDLSNNNAGAYGTGYIDSDGYIHAFTEFPQFQLPWDQQSGIYKKGKYELDSYIDTGTIHFRTQGFFASQNLALYPETSGIYDLAPSATYISPLLILPEQEVIELNVSGSDWLYGDSINDWLSGSGGSDWNLGDPDLRFSTFGAMQAAQTPYQISLIPYQFGPMNSFIEVGLFRIMDQQYADYLSYMTDFILGTDTTPAGQIYNDWLEGDSVNDWLLGDDKRDWGSDVYDIVDFGISVKGSLDGITTFYDQEIEPILHTDDGNMRLYTLTCNGMYFSIKLTALEVQQSFHLKLLEPSLTLGGRLA